MAWKKENLETCRKCEHWIEDDFCYAEHQGDYQGEVCESFEEIPHYNDNLEAPFTWTNSHPNEQNLVTCNNCGKSKIRLIGRCHGGNYEGYIYRCNNCDTEIIQKIRK